MTATAEDTVEQDTDTTWRGVARVVLGISTIVIGLTVTLVHALHAMDGPSPIPFQTVGIVSTVGISLCLIGGVLATRLERRDEETSILSSLPLWAVGRRVFGDEATLKLFCALTGGYSLLCTIPLAVTGSPVFFGIWASGIAFASIELLGEYYDTES